MRKWLIGILLLSAGTASAQSAWTWVDAEGQVHFSDTPVPGARQIQLSGAQTFSAPATPAPSSAAGATAAPATATPYQALEIVTPAAQATLSNIGSTLTVQVGTNPPLQAGHRLDVLYDGRRLNLNTTGQTLTVPDVFRGQHTVQAVVIDARGQELQRSAAVTFFVRQTSIQNPSPVQNPSRPPRPQPRPGN